MISFSESICRKIVNNVEISDELTEKTLKHIFDYYASSIAGYRLNKCFNYANYELYSSMKGDEESSVLFSDIKIPSSSAAYINAIYAHGADIDDGNSKSAGHIGTHIIPAVFAVAEADGFLWRDVIKAINVGYDVFNWIGELSQPYLYEKGFHSTGIIGVIGCAAACANLMKLNYDAVYNAISLACIQASGLLIIDESGQGCKPLNAGNAAQRGVISALLAQKGVGAPMNPFESKKGWFNVFAKEIDLEKAETLMQHTIRNCYMKVFPGCRHTHACIEAAINIVDEVEDINRIKKISIYIYKHAIRSAGEIVHPMNSDEAKFSITYAVAVAFLTGDFTIDDVVHVRNTDDVKALEDKIELISDESMINYETAKRGCYMKVSFLDRHDAECRIEYPKGEYEKQLSWSDLEKKMINCASGVLQKKEILRILEYVKNIDIYREFAIVNEMHRKVGL